MPLVTSDGEIDVPGSLLVVVAHPDDIDFGFAGTVATLTAAGCRVSYCLVTSGDAGGFDDGIPREEMPLMREAEQREAAKRVGVSDLHFLRFPDGRVEPSLELRKAISRVIRQVRPDVVACQSPERGWDSVYRSHPDHLATGEATIRAVYPDARNPYAFPELREEEGLEAHTVPEVWVLGLGPARYIDVTESFGAKVEALRAHVSQTGHMEDLDGRIREWMTNTAADAGFPEGRLAEAHRRIDTA
ncbi:MAG: PIG-L deacetylase family protein [Actinomycetota bacterium]